MNKAQEIKNRVDIVEAISAFVTLKKSGVNYVAFCPFHDEKTPSFSVNKNKQFYHCFGGCGSSGDIINFYQQYLDLSFKDALKKISDDFNLGLDFQTKKNFQKRTGIKALDKIPDEDSKNKQRIKFKKKIGAVHQTHEKGDIKILHELLATLFFESNVSLSEEYQEYVTLFYCPFTSKKVAAQEIKYLLERIYGKIKPQKKK